MDVANLNNKDRKNKRKSMIDLSTMVYGKVPPQAKDLEEAILGAIMLEKEAFERVSDILKAESFYVDAHQRIFRAMVSMREKGWPIEMMTVVEELKIREELEVVGGAYYVVKLTNKVVESANIETHARIVQQKFMQREMIRICGEGIAAAYEDATDVFDLLDDHEKQFTGITSDIHQSKIVDPGDAVIESLKRIELRRASESKITGVATGFKELDRITAGLQPSNLIILAARPSVGKTAFALQLARNAAKETSGTVAVFSLEMPRSQLMERLLSSEAEIDLEKISRGNMSDAEWLSLSNAAARVADYSIYIDDKSGINIFQLKSKIRAIKRRSRKKPLKMVIIDYLQLMSGTAEARGNREQDISKISRDLKTLAKELDVPIVALSQLSRDIEKRKGEDARPKLADLRESGAIEQDADDVFFLYRPENTFDMGSDVRNEVRVYIAKHRNGVPGNVINLTSKLSIQKFFDKESETGNFKPVPQSSLFVPYKEKIDIPFDDEF